MYLIDMKGTTVKTMRQFAFGSLVVLAASTVAIAEEQAVATPAAAQPAQPEKQVEPAKDEPIVIEYIEADIQNVLRTLAAKAGINLILGDEVAGKVTVHLEGVSYEEAMRLIVESKGYAYVKDRSVVKVKSRDSLETEPVEVKMYTLKYAKADDVRKTIEAVLTKQGKLQVDVRSNTLVISDTPSNLSKIVPLIDTLDSQTTQVLIEAKFVETQKNPHKDLGVNWSNTLVDHEVVAGSTLIRDAANGKPVSGFQVTKDLANAGPWIPTTALLDAGQAKIVFSYLNSDSDTELLANPRVVTVDNGKARISIARQVPIPNFTFSEQTASLQISGFEYKDIGIILNVTPRINKDEFVTLEVTPEASSAAGNQPLSSGGGSVVNIPIINTRTATTTVLIKSGYTLAIGGLMQQDTDNTYTKVPLMGDIPLVGSLFRSKKLDKKKRDLLIFLTPTIVRPDAQTGYEKHYSGLPETSGCRAITPSSVDSSSQPPDQPQSANRRPPSSRTSRPDNQCAINGPLTGEGRGS
jgi:type IV pilus assembly protein PilQ